MSSNPSEHPTPIVAAGLSKTYRLGFLMNRTVRALQGLDLAVSAGQVFGLLGPNGAGKSTTIKILLNLVRPSQGEARLFGQSPSSLAVRRMIGFLPENPSPYEYLTGREFVTLAGRLSGLSGHELDQRVTEVLGAVEMGKAHALQIRRYSKGMVQRVALAQALVGRPKLLVLDEPTSGLDPIGRRQMRDLILEQRARGTTILFCTHIIPDVEALCDEVAMLVGGKRVRQGTVGELLGQQDAKVEVSVENLAEEKTRALLPVATSVSQSSGRVVVQLPEDRVQPFLSAVLGQGGRIARVQPVRSSLEDLFLAVVQEAAKGSPVGGEINT